MNDKKRLVLASMDTVNDRVFMRDVTLDELNVVMEVLEIAKNIDTCDADIDKVYRHQTNILLHKLQEVIGVHRGTIATKEAFTVH